MSESEPEYIEPGGDQDQDPPNTRLLIRAIRDHLRDTQPLLEGNETRSLAQVALRHAVVRWLEAHQED